MSLNPEISRVVLASTSTRRQDFSHHAFADTHVDFHPGGEERKSSNVTRVMHGKIDTVLSQLTEKGMLEHNEQVLILAADTKTATICLTGDKLHLVSRGKPEREEEVRGIFASMSRASLESNTSPMYVVESASGAHSVRSNTRREAKHYCIVELQPEAVTHFATQEGFEKYKKEFDAFYRGPAYAFHGTPLTITDISGGLSLPVLVKMKAVTSIDRVPIDDPSFKETFKKAIFTVAVGLAPEVWGEQNDIGHAWPWLGQVAAQCFEPTT